MVDRERLVSPAILFFLVFLSFPEESQANVMVTQPGISDRECEKRCKEETEIDCRFYKFHRLKLTCFLSAKNDTSLTHMRKVDKPPGKQTGTKPASSWISELQSRVLLLEKKDIHIKALQRDIVDLRQEITGLKNSRALTHHLIRTNKEQQDANMEALDEKAVVLKSEVKRIQDALMTLGEIQKSFGKKINEINEDRKSTGLTMSMLGQSNKNMKSSIQELSVLSGQVQQSISEIRKEMTDVEVRFAGLSSDVMEKAASVESMIGPEIKELQTTQTSLAEALSLITKKIMRLTPRIPELQRLVTTNDGMVTAVAKRVKDFHKEMEQLTGRIGFAESQLRNLMDPGSKLSQDRRLLIAHLREDVQALRSSQKRLQSDVLMEISDRTRLYKELSQIKLSKKMFVTDVANLREQFKKMDKEMRNIILNGPQGDLISKILHRQVEVLKKMKLVQEQQVNMREDLGRFTKEMKLLSSDALATAGTATHFWNKTEGVRRLNSKIEQLDLKLKNLSMTNERLEHLQKMEKVLSDNLQRMKIYQNLAWRPSMNPYVRMRQDQDKVDLERLRGQTDALDDLVKQTVSRNKMTPKMESKLRNIIREHRDKLEQQVLNQHINGQAVEMADHEAPTPPTALQDHLESLHKILSSLARNGEDEGS